MSAIAVAAWVVFGVVFGVVAGLVIAGCLIARALTR